MKFLSNRRHGRFSRLRRRGHLTPDANESPRNEGREFWRKVCATLNAAEDAHEIPAWTDSANLWLGGMIAITFAQPLTEPQHQYLVTRGLQVTQDKDTAGCTWSIRLADHVVEPPTVAERQAQRALF